MYRVISKGQEAVRTTVALPVDLVQRSQRFIDDGTLPNRNGGLTLDSVALTGQVRAIAKTRLLRRRGALSPEVVEQVARALRVTMDL